MAAILKPDIAFRVMYESDLSRVLRIEKASYEFPWTEGIFRDCLRVGYRCLILEINGEMAGYSISSIIAGECHVLNVCIERAYRRLGYGRLFMERIIDEARIAEAGMVYLEVRPSNRVALDLYLSLGFEQLAERKGYYPARGGREDALLLAYMLQAGS